MSDTKKVASGLHIGFILDGNRRWATENGLPVKEGHKKGFDNFRKIADACLEWGVSYLSVFAFSTENWNRSKDEVSFLMSFIQLVIKKYISDLQKKNIRFIWLGSSEGLSDKIINQLQAAEEASANNTAGTICLCFNYGGQQEIAEAANKLARANKPITVDSLTDNMYAGKNVPPLDLIIRTSGEQRLSNFMLWRAAYSELYFSAKNWPEFSTIDLDEALKDYENRKRRFGK
jgi:undecaprenyl diphosphate synthase